MKAHGKSAHKPRSLDEVDVELEEAITDLRRRVEHTAHGRVFLVVERLDRVTTEHRIYTDASTCEDIAKVMVEIPRPRRGR